MEAYLKTKNTLRQLVSAPRDPLKKEQVSGVVYQIDCEEGRWGAEMGEVQQQIRRRDRQDPHEN